MKTTKQIIATVVLTLTVALLASLAYKPAAHSSIINSAADMQAVTITAMRMTDEQKAAFDLEEANMQSVVVIGKAMTAEQKRAFDRANKG